MSQPGNLIKIASEDIPVNSQAVVKTYDSLNPLRRTFLSVLKGGDTVKVEGSFNDEDFFTIDNSADDTVKGDSMGISAIRVTTAQPMSAMTNVVITQGLK